jgi:diadenosine tetraphosphate (Ap4A) HIT family hydrolase
MNEDGFTLDERLAQGGVEIAQLPLCVALLKQDARWPWAILIPRRAHLTEVHQLSTHDSAQLMREIRGLCAAITAEAGVEKVNVAALGNVVRQLHVHVVGRWAGDPCWPDPVFGAPGKTAYTQQARISRVARLAGSLARLAHSSE